MRLAIRGFLFLVCLAGGAAADPLAIEQKAKTNYAVIVSSNKDVSNVSVKQSGSINGAVSAQSAKLNTIGASQSGWQNTVVVYQEGWVDTSAVVQQGPQGEAGAGHLPTSYHRETTDDGYLTYFTSGGFSMVTLTGPGNTITSRFGRYR